MVLSSRRGELLRALRVCTIQHFSLPDAVWGRTKLVIWGLIRNGISSGKGRNYMYKQNKYVHSHNNQFHVP